MLNLTSLKKGINSLETALKVSKQTAQMSDEIRETVQAGVIQNFEFSYEL